MIHVIVRYGMDEKTAFEVESAVIDSTPGLTNIQSGYSQATRFLRRESNKPISTTKKEHAMCSFLICRYGFSPFIRS